MTEKQGFTVKQADALARRIIKTLRSGATLTQDQLNRLSDAYTRADSGIDALSLRPLGLYSTLSDALRQVNNIQVKGYGYSPELRNTFSSYLKDHARKTLAGKYIGHPLTSVQFVDHRIRFRDGAFEIDPVLRLDQLLSGTQDRIQEANKLRDKHLAAYKVSGRRSPIVYDLPGSLEQHISGRRAARFRDLVASYPPEPAKHRMPLSEFAKKYGTEWLFKGNATKDKVDRFATGGEGARLSDGTGFFSKGKTWWTTNPYVASGYGSHRTDAGSASDIVLLPLTGQLRRRVQSEAVPHLMNPDLGSQRLENFLIKYVPGYRPLSRHYDTANRSIGYEYVMPPDLWSRLRQKAINAKLYYDATGDEELPRSWGATRAPGKKDPIIELNNGYYKKDPTEYIETEKRLATRPWPIERKFNNGSYGLTLEDILHEYTRRPDLSPVPSEYIAETSRDIMPSPGVPITYLKAKYTPGDVSLANWRRGDTYAKPKTMFGRWLFRARSKAPNFRREAIRDFMIPEDPVHAPRFRNQDTDVIQSSVPKNKF